MMQTKLAAYCAETPQQCGRALQVWREGADMPVSRLFPIRHLYRSTDKLQGTFQLDRSRTATALDLAGRQHLTRTPLQIVDHMIDVPTVPGLGVEFDMDAIDAALALYNNMGLGAPDAALAMQ